MSSLKDRTPPEAGQARCGRLDRLSGTSVRRDVQVMADGSILVPCWPVPSSVYIKRYDPSGATLNTYTTATVGGPYDHLILDLDPARFMLADQTSTERHFYQIRASDGAVIYHSTTPRFNAGVSGASGDDAERFGASQRARR